MGRECCHEGIERDTGNDLHDELNQGYSVSILVLAKEVVPANYHSAGKWGG